MLFLSKKQKTKNNRIFAFLNEKQKKLKIRKPELFLTKKTKENNKRSLLFLSKQQKTKNKRIFAFLNKKNNNKNNKRIFSFLIKNSKN